MEIVENVQVTSLNTGVCMLMCYNYCTVYMPWNAEAITLCNKLIHSW